MTHELDIESLPLTPSQKEDVVGCIGRAKELIVNQEMNITGINFYLNELNLLGGAVFEVPIPENEVYQELTLHKQFRHRFPAFISLATYAGILDEMVFMSGGSGAQEEHISDEYLGERIAQWKPQAPEVDVNNI